MRGGTSATCPPPGAPVIVFQNYALFPNLNVAENIGYGLGPAALAPGAGSTELLARGRPAPAGALGRRYPRQLSGRPAAAGGAGAGAGHQPSCCCSTSPCRPWTPLRVAVQGELRRLQRRLGITFMLVTHDQDEAMAVSDRILVMEGGRIAQGGTPAEVYDRPRTRFVAEFLARPT